MAPDGSLLRPVSSCPSAFSAASFVASSRLDSSNSSSRTSYSSMAHSRNWRFRHFLRQLFTHEWVVYAKAPFGGAEHVLHYLARYTHRVAISNHRLLAFKDDRVSFRWKDYACGSKQKVMTLSTDEFLRRFLIHVLPKGLVRIRHFGLFANCRRAASLLRCHVLLGMPSSPQQPASTSQLRCPSCSEPMIILERMTGAQLHFRSTHMPSHSLPRGVDSS
jgi:Putative transposase